MIDAALSRATVAMVEGRHMAALRQGSPEMGLADLLPVWAEECLGEAQAMPEAVAVTVGPGSFTGLRAAIALAEGIGLALSLPVHGVGMGEAFAAALPGLRRPLWVATAARRGRVFIEIDGNPRSYDETDLPTPGGPIALAGDRAAPVAASLAARGHDVMLTDARYPSSLAIAVALRERMEAGLPPRRAVPAYVDPPEAKLPAGGLRPPPA